jgi:hypothetical protein
MVYKSILALATATVMAATLTVPTSDANARGFGGFRHGGFHGFHGGFRHGGFGFRGPRFWGPRVYAGVYGYGGCWRWVPGYYGPRRVWVCGPYY